MSPTPTPPSERTPETSVGLPSAPSSPAYGPPPGISAPSNVYPYHPPPEWQPPPPNGSVQLIQHDLAVIAPIMPDPNDPNTTILRKPYPIYVNYLYLDMNPNTFLDARDFVGSCYPVELEPQRGRCGKRLAALEKSVTDTPLRCPFCRRSYGGTNGRSMWRRHIWDKHDIAMSNRRHMTVKGRGPTATPTPSGSSTGGSEQGGTSPFKPSRPQKIFVQTQGKPKPSLGPPLTFAPRALGSDLDQPEAGPSNASSYYPPVEGSSSYFMRDGPGYPLHPVHDPSHTKMEVDSDTPLYASDGPGPSRSKSSADGTPTEGSPMQWTPPRPVPVRGQREEPKVMPVLERILALNRVGRVGKLGPVRDWSTP